MSSQGFFGHDPQDNDSNMDQNNVYRDTCWWPFFKSCLPAIIIIALVCIAVLSWR